MDGDEDRIGARDIEDDIEGDIEERDSDDDPDMRSSHCTGATDHFENLQRTVELAPDISASRAKFGIAAQARIFLD